MPGHLLGVAAGDQGGDGDQAAIPRHELGALPDIAEQHVVGVGRERRRDRLHVGRRHPRRVALLGLGPGSQRTEASVAANSFIGPLSGIVGQHRECTT